MDKTFSEILQSITGKDERGEPKTAITLFVNEITVSSEKEKELSVISLFEPEFKLMKLDEFVVLDINFKNNYNTDLRRIWAVLENFGDMCTKNENRDILYRLSIMLLPMEYAGKIYLLASSPIFWVLQSSVTGDKPNSIRLLFKEEFMSVYESDGVDTDRILKTVEKEIEAEVNQQIQMELKQEEEDRNKAERDAKMEELRRSMSKEE